MKSDLPERTFKFAVQIVKLCKVLDEKSGVSKTLVNQLLRSGTSIGANVQEGQSSQSEADFLAKYNIACKEARETHYWLRLLVASELFSEGKVHDLTNECNELLLILNCYRKET